MALHRGDGEKRTHIEHALENQHWRRISSTAHEMISYVHVELQ
jgi:hypothetical protein